MWQVESCKEIVVSMSPKGYTIKKGSQAFDDRTSMYPTEKMAGHTIGLKKLNVKILFQSTLITLE